MTLWLSFDIAIGSLGEDLLRVLFLLPFSPRSAVVVLSLFFVCWVSVLSVFRSRRCGVVVLPMAFRPDADS